MPFKLRNKMLKLNTLGLVALGLVIIGAINWGLAGLSNGFDFVEALFGEIADATIVEGADLPGSGKVDIQV